MAQSRTTEEYINLGIPKLGFGLMRLPKKEDGEFDEEQICQMVDAFLDAGMTYFDTAFAYPGSEEVIRKALIERYPREKFYIASKLNAHMKEMSEEEAKQEIFTSLERLGTDYLDFYLLHALTEKNIEIYENYHLFDYVRELKEREFIRHYGFSFHGTPTLLDEILTNHPDLEFVQLQINYADWENPAVRSRECYKVARDHDKRIVIMEPVKGGTLANPPQVVKDIFHAENPYASYASFAVRYAASLDGVITVLSGMSTLEQMKDNLSYMEHFIPMNWEEVEAIKKAQEALESIPQIQCTSCQYCVPTCPMNIPIPRIFSALNRKLIFEDEKGAKDNYEFATRNSSKASDCIQCGTCENQCPQHLDIIEFLKASVEVFGE